MNIEEAVLQWQQIYDLSLPMIVADDSEIWTIGNYPVDDEGRPYWRALCDLRTICMGGGRQNGKNSWIARFMAENPKAILVEVNSSLRDYFVDAWKGPGDVFTRVFTIMDIVTISARNIEGKVDLLKDATHVIFNDASHNNAINSMQLAKACNGLFTKSTVIVKMG